MIAITRHLSRNHWPALIALGLWFLVPWFAAALGVDLSMALRFSWLAAMPYAVYVYRALSGSRLLAVVPLERRTMWHITSAMCALVPALLQLAVASLSHLLAQALMPIYASLRLVGMDTMVLGAIYSVVFLQLVVASTAAILRRRLFTAAPALAGTLMLAWFTERLPSNSEELSSPWLITLWAVGVLTVVIIRHPGPLVAPLSAHHTTTKVQFDLPGIAILDRLTGVKRILLVQILFGGVCFGAALGLQLALRGMVEGPAVAAYVADELRAFSSSSHGVFRPGDSWFFLPMWIIGFVNVWTPMARLLRALPLTTREINVLFLASPVGMWVCIWLMLLATYAIVVGGPMAPRIDLFLAVSGSSTLANVISLRWKNRLYGMFGAAFVYGFWMVASIVAFGLNLAEANVTLGIIGAVFYIAAIVLNHDTLVHATSASPAYQRQPKFFDTPARG